MIGYGYPQGFLKNGFVRTGIHICDTSYTLSFPNTKVKTPTVINGVKIN